MGMIESIAATSTNISMLNVAQEVSISVLKNAMEQSEAGIKDL